MRQAGRLILFIDSISLAHFYKKKVKSFKLYLMKEKTQKLVFLINKNLKRILTVQSDFTISRPETVLRFAAVLAQVII